MILPLTIQFYSIKSTLRWSITNIMGSEQTDPLQPLPTVFGSWMGNRITPSNLSELFCWWIVFIHTFFIEIIVFIVFNPTFRMINSPVKKIRRETPKSPMMSTRKNNQRWPEGPAATA